MGGRRGLHLALIALLAVGPALTAACSLPGPRGRAPWEAPTADVVALADELGLTDTGRRLFLRAGPVLAPASEVEEACTRLGHDTHRIDGCYVGGDTAAILVRELPDERLHPIELRTATWGLLMVAYDHVDTLDREPLDALVEAQLAALPADHPIRAELAERAEDDPAAADQQAFAVLGSELTDPLAPELEAVYAHWLADRAATASAGGAAYASLDATAAELSQAWDAQVTQESANAQARAQLDADRKAVEETRLAYNTAVNDFNAVPPDARAGRSMSWTLWDGTQIPLQPTGDALAAVRERLVAAPADLGARAAALDQADATAATARSALDARQADHEALVAQAWPGSASADGVTGTAPAEGQSE